MAHKSFTRRELDVMSVLWELGSATVADVRDRLHDDLSYSTVMTVLRTLEFKAHIRHGVEGKAHRFVPVTQRDEAGESALRRVVDKVYHGSRELVVTRLLADEDVSPEELRRIREHLDSRIKELES